MDITPYSTAKPWLTGVPAWMDPYDGERIASYALYENMYWNTPDTFKLSQLGTDDMPVYIPNAKVIIEAILRYLCVDWTIAMDPDVGSEEGRKAALGHMRRLMKRENLKAKFATQLRYCLIRGDAMWHVVADSDKKAGTRISIHELDPASYFPILDEDNLDRIIGCHIVDTIPETDPRGNVRDVIRRQTYRKEMNDDGVFTGVVTSELCLFELTGWDDRSLEPKDLKLIDVLEPEAPLPEQITQLPVYHWKNVRNPADPYGSSQIRGLERLMAAVNQTISDEDLAVALAGLGVFATDAPDPVDEDGNPTNWLIGPGRVVSTATGAKFARVDGVRTIAPSQDHVAYLENKIREGAGVPAIAVGDVDVRTAESGIALAIRMSPIIASNAEKQLEILGKTDQMIYDLQTMWFPAYEDIDMGDVIAESQVGDPMPRNRAAEVKEVLSLATAQPPLITIGEARMRLAELGYDGLGDDATDILQQLTDIASRSDIFGSRMSAELERNEDDPEEDDDDA